MTKRHTEISKNLLKLSTNLLNEGNESKDPTIINLAVMFLVINGALVDGESFETLYNQIKMFSNAQLFNTVMDSPLKPAIVEMIDKLSLDDKDLEKALDTTLEMFGPTDNKDNFISCICPSNEVQPYDGILFPEHKGFCLNCGGKIRG